MMIFKNNALAFALAFFVFAIILGMPGHAQNETNLRESFESIIKEVFPKNIERDLLRKNLASSPVKSTSVAETETDLICVSLRHFPDSVSESHIKNVLSSYSIHQMMRFQALNNKDLMKKLQAFKYPDILIEYAGQRLIGEVSGKVVVWPLSVRHFRIGNYSGVAVRVPKKHLVVHSVNLISDQQAMAQYRVALSREVKNAMKRSAYEQAANLFFELRTFGNESKELYVGLFECYLRAGEKLSAKKILDFLESTYGEEVSFNDWLELGLLAEEEGNKALMDRCYLKAENKVDVSLSLDILTDPVD